jgi:N utilization substance protein B
MLFEIDLARRPVAEVVPGFWRERDVPPETREFAERLVSGVVERRDALDATIDGAASHWRIERMPVVDRNVLRMAVFEMTGEPPVPSPVVIDEAIELAKRFGGAESGAFVNGVLDAVRQRLGLPGSVDTRP